MMEMEEPRSWMTAAAAASREKEEKEEKKEEEEKKEDKNKKEEEKEEESIHSSSRQERMDNEHTLVLRLVTQQHCEIGKPAQEQNEKKDCSDNEKSENDDEDEEEEEEEEETEGEEEAEKQDQRDQEQDQRDQEQDQQEEDFVMVNHPHSLGSPQEATSSFLRYKVPQKKDPPASSASLSSSSSSSSSSLSLRMCQQQEQESLSELLWKHTKQSNQEWIAAWTIVTRLQHEAAAPETHLGSLLQALSKLLQRMAKAAAAAGTAAAAAASSASSAPATAPAAAVVVVVVGVGVVLPVATLVHSFSKLQEACRRVDESTRGNHLRDLSSHWDLLHQLELLLQQSTTPHLVLLGQEVQLENGEDDVGEDWAVHCRQVGLSLLRARRLLQTFLTHWEPWYEDLVQELQQGKAAARASGMTKLGMGGTSGLVACVAAAASSSSSSSASAGAPFLWTATASAATGGTAAAAAVVATAAATAAVAAGAAAGTDLWARRKVYRHGLAQLQEFAHGVLQLKAQLDRHLMDYQVVLQQCCDGNDEWKVWGENLQQEINSISHS